MARHVIEHKRAQLRLLDLGPDTDPDAATAPFGGRRFSDQRLAWDRLEDLRRLVELCGGTLADHRRSIG